MKFNWFTCIYIPKIIYFSESKCKGTYFPILEILALYVCTYVTHKRQLYSFVIFSTNGTKSKPNIYRQISLSSMNRFQNEFYII